MAELNKLFTYTDYKKYLNDMIDENEDVRGYKSSLADAAGCQRSFMSQVLNSHVHLTPDHALGLAEFWKLDRSATEFFLELVHYGRAATPALRSHLLRRLKGLADSERDAAVRVENPSLQEIEHQATYYSNWYWSALHMLVEVKGYQTEKALSDRLHLPLPMVKEALKILQSMDLVKKDRDQWRSTHKSLHAPVDSIYSWLHHGSWRTRANENMRHKARQSGPAVHFTSIYSLSSADREKIEDQILALLDKTNKIVAPSPEEDAACLCIDWFGV